MAERGFSFFWRSLNGAAVIRGVQMAEQLGGRVNPPSGFEEDVCIYIKRKPPEQDHPKRTVLDVVDDFSMIPWMRRHPAIELITPHLQAVASLRRQTRCRVAFIPEQHCNYDNELRPDRPIRRVGVIGGHTAFQWPEEDSKRLFGELGLEFLHQKVYHNRMDVVRFYRDLDIQVVYRPWYFRPLMCDPLKLKNAGSFGIPTVAYPEPAYLAEFAGCFLEAQTPYEVVAQVKRLMDSRDLYAEFAEKARERAAEYHVDKVVDLYRRLAR